MIIFPNCKLNLGLTILRKRDDGFHDLETIFYPIPILDILEIIPAKKPDESRVSFSKSGLPIDDNGDNNLCIKAYHLLKDKFPQIPPVEMHLHKTIPAGAGLGGGSADGAFTILLLNKLFNLQLSTGKLKELAAKLGSDCPFFIINTACFSQGRGEILEEIALDLSAYKFVIVNPGIHVDTGAMFKKIKPSLPAISLKEIIKQPVQTWKADMKNDFEEIAFQLHPEIKNIKEELYKAGAVYASMSGSGSSVYGIFTKQHPVALSFAPHYFIKEIS